MKVIKTSWEETTWYCQMPCIDAKHTEFDICHPGCNLVKWAPLMTATKTMWNISRDVNAYKKIQNTTAQL